MPKINLANFLSKIGFLAFLLSILFIYTNTAAAPDKLLNYQARITDPSGTPVPDGTFSVTFTIYNAPTGGNTLWQETQITTTKNGIIDTRLGSTNPLNLDFNTGRYYLGVRIENDSELTPRRAIGAAPFALNASLLDGRPVGTDPNNILALDNNADLNLPNNITAGGAITLGNISTGANGRIRFTGSDFEGFMEGNWYSLTGEGFFVLAGQAGGQIAYGGTLSSENLILRSTSSSTKGKILLADDGGEVVVGTLGNATLSVPGQASSSEQFGAGAIAASIFSTAIGSNATTQPSSAHSFGATAVGAGAHAGTYEAVALGFASNATGWMSTAIGGRAEAPANQSIAIGNRSIADEPNSLVIGNNFEGGYQIYNAYIGAGRTSGFAQGISFTLNATGGKGNNIGGSHLQIAGGRPTGSGNGGEIRLQTASSGSSGSALQPLTTRWIVTKDGNFIPGVNNQYSIGTNTVRVSDLYLGPNSLHIGSSTSDEGTISYNTTTDTLNLGINSITQLLISNTGNVVQGTGTLATTATDGFPYIPSMTGTPTGTPTSYTGRVPFTFNTATNTLYFYNAGWQSIGGSGTIGGSGLANQVTFWSGASTVAGSNDFIWNGSSLNITGNGAFTGSLSANSLSLTTPLPVTSGGTGRNTLTSNALLYGNGTSMVNLTNTPTPGQILLGNASSIPTFTTIVGDIAISSTGVATIQPGSVDLGSDTNGDYVEDINSGNGINVTGSGGPASNPTIALGPLTANWSQTGAFGIQLNNLGAYLSINNSFLNTVADGDFLIGGGATGKGLINIASDGDFVQTRLGPGTTELATNATSGFFFFTATNGNPVGTPANTYGGTVPMTYDIIGNNLYVYNGGWQQVGGAGNISGSGAANQVTYWNGTNTVTGSNNFMWNGTQLSVTGNGSFSGSLSANDLTLTTSLAVGYGGTGRNTLTTNGVLYGNGTSAINMTAAPTAGQILLGNGSGVPTFTTISGDITINASGVATIDPSFASGFATTELDNLGTTAINTNLLPDTNNTRNLGSNTLRWQDIFLGPSTMHIGTSTSDEAQFSYNTSTNTFGINFHGGANSLALTDTGSLVQGQGTLATNATNGFLYFSSTAGTPAGVPTTYTGRTPITYNTSSNTLYVYNGGWQAVGAGSGNVSGTGTVNQVTYWTGANAVSGSNNFMWDGAQLSVTGTGSFSGSLTANSLTISTPLAVGSGGTGRNTLTTNGVIYGNGTSQVNSTAAPTGGQLLVGNASGVPTFMTITGDLTISNSGVATVTGGSIGGSGTAGQVTYWSGASTVTGSSTFLWDNTSTRLSLGATPATTGIIALPNNTGINWKDSTNTYNVGISLNNTNKFAFDTVGPSTDIYFTENGGSAGPQNWFFENPSAGVMNLIGEGYLALHNANAFGANLPTTGIIRLPNNQSITARNAANSADIGLIKLMNDNGIQIGEGLSSSNAVNLHIGTSSAQPNTLNIQQGANVANVNIEGFLAVHNTNNFAANIATAGTLRFANNQSILWRNSANNANIGLSIDASNMATLTAPLFIDPVGTYTGNPITTPGFFKVDNATFQDTATAASGTTAQMLFGSFMRPTLTAANTAVTTTNAATVYIQNSPLASTNQTITNAYALWVDDGTVRFDGTVLFNNNLSLGTNFATTGILRLPNNQGIFARNAANSANVGLIKLDASDRIQIGEGQATVDLQIGTFDTFTKNLNILNAVNGGGLANVNIEGYLTVHNNNNFTNPIATTGTIRLGNNNGIVARNAADNANFGLITLDSSDRIQIGDGQATVDLQIGTFNTFGKTLNIQNAAVSGGGLANVNIEGYLAVHNNDNFTNPIATTGTIRLANNQSIVIRDAANSADRTLLGMNSSDFATIQAPLFIDPTGTYTGNPTSTNGFFKVDSATFQDTATAASGTTTQMLFGAFMRPTLTAANTSVTTTNAATLYIENSPLASTNQTIANAYALWVDAGNVRIDNQVGIGASSVMPSLSPNPRLHISHGASGVTSVNNSVGLVVESSTTAELAFLTPNNGISNIIFGDVSEPSGAAFLSYNHASDFMMLGRGGSGATLRMHTTASQASLNTTNGFGLKQCEDPNHDLKIGGTGTDCNTGTYSEIDAGESTFTVSSSRTLKQNFNQVQGSNILEKISQIPVYTYDFKPGACGTKDGCKNKMGLIAEDFYSIFSRGSNKQINGQEMIMALWLGVQELTKEVNNLKVASIKKDVDDLKITVASLDTKVNTIKTDVAGIKDRVKDLEDKASLKYPAKTNLPVAKDAEELLIEWTNPVITDDYSVFITPNWITNFAITEKSSNSFKILFGTPAPENALIDYKVEK